MLPHHTPDLRLRCCGAWLLAFLLLSVVPSRAALQLMIEPEEPSGAFWAAQTVRTQTELLFALRLRNDADEERLVYLTWHIIDARGKTRLKEDVKLSVAARGAVVRRLLFDAPARGAYMLSVEAATRHDGDVTRVTAEAPFAVVSTPEPAYRPHSFFAVNAPPILSVDELRFYNRIGARVLRSEWMPGQSTPDGQPLTEQLLDAQFQARINNNLATIAVLPHPPGMAGELWLQQALAAAQRYRGILAWEARGSLSQGVVADWTDAMRALRPDAKVWAPSVPGGSSDSSQGWTSEVASAIRQQPPAAQMRLFLSQVERARSADKALLIRHTQRPEDEALDAAGQMVARSVMAIGAGAEGISATLPTPQMPGLWSAQRMTAMAEAAAFAEMVTRLEDATFSREVWSHLPTLWGVVFKRPGQSVAVVWAEGEGQLKVQWPATSGQDEACIYDLFGNEIGAGKKGRVFIPLGPQPVYVVSSAGPNEVGEAIGKGEVSGLPELGAQIQPVTRVPLEGKAAPLRVVLQNLGIEAATGTVHLSPPRGWKLETAQRQFTLKPGEYAIYEFPVTQARATDNGLYPVTITANFNRRRRQWAQTARIATAVNVQEGETMRTDGALDEWSDAAWMRIEAERKTDPLKSAQLTLKWNADNLFVAARVREDKLTPRDDSEPEYSFWQQSDALQLAFGMRDENWMRPARGRFRDSDYGFLLSPFRALADGTIEARVLRLWSPTRAFGELPDRVRYAGVAPGARCVIRRDETAGLTFYEAVIPLNTMPELQPMLRSTDALSAPPLRFGWVLHNETGGPLQWGREAGVFARWNNPGSFLPADALHFAVQSELGFTKVGDVGGTTLPDTPPTTPLQSTPVAPIVKPTPAPTPTPTPKREPPIYTPPMPIDLLPPAAPVEGWPLPPSTP